MGHVGEGEVQWGSVDGTFVADDEVDVVVEADDVEVVAGDAALQLCVINSL